MSIIDSNIDDAWCKAKERLFQPIIDMYGQYMEMMQEFSDSIDLSKERHRIMSKNFRLMNRLPKKIRDKVDVSYRR